MPLRMHSATRASRDGSMKTSSGSEPPQLPNRHAGLQLLASADARHMAITAADRSRSAVHCGASGRLRIRRGVKLEAKEDELSSPATSSCTASMLRASFEAVVLRDLRDSVAQ